MYGDGDLTNDVDVGLLVGAPGGADGRAQLSGDDWGWGWNPVFCWNRMKTRALACTTAPRLPGTGGRGQARFAGRACQLQGRRGAGHHHAGHLPISAWHPSPTNWPCGRCNLDELERDREIRVKRENGVRRPSGSGTTRSGLRLAAATSTTASGSYAAGWHGMKPRHRMTGYAHPMYRTTTASGLPWVRTTGFRKT